MSVIAGASAAGSRCELRWLPTDPGRSRRCGLLLAISLGTLATAASAAFWGWHPSRSASAVSEDSAAVAPIAFALSASSPEHAPLPSTSGHRSSAQAGSALELPPDALELPPELPPPRASAADALRGVRGSLVSGLFGFPWGWGSSGDENDVMRERSFGTCLVRPHRTLRWGSPVDVADDICCHSRGKLEPKKLYLQLLGTDALSVAEWRKHETMTFYDTVTSKPLFIIDNKVRRFKDFMLDSKRHGHPTFREHERVAENTEVLRDFGSLGGGGEIVSVDGTHLGRNIPDAQGPRYSVSLVCIAGLKGDADARSTLFDQRGGHLDRTRTSPPPAERARLRIGPRIRNTPYPDNDQLPAVQYKRIGR